MITDIDRTSEQEKELLLCAPEISVWMAVFGGLRTLSELQVEYIYRRINKKQYVRLANETLIKLAQTADATHRFDVLLPSTIEPHCDRRLSQLTDAYIRVEFSVSFWSWFNWWHDYITSLSISDRKHIYRLAMERILLVDRYRPSGDWLNYRAQPSLVLATV